MVGGSSLLEVTPHSHHVWRLPLPAEGYVTAIASAGQGAWVAVNQDHGRSPAELWYVSGHRVLKRLTTTATDIHELAWSDDGLWATTFDHEHIALSAVEPTGHLQRMAQLPSDARSLTATRGALWTADYRESRISEVRY